MKSPPEYINQEISRIFNAIKTHKQYKQYIPFTTCDV